MIRLHTRSTLIPNTTLFRSVDHQPPPSSIQLSSTPFRARGTRRQPNGSVLQPARHPISATGHLTNRPGHDLDVGVRIPLRSEEHTSELQSPDHLQCRLLLDI